MRNIVFSMISGVLAFALVSPAGSQSTSPGDNAPIVEPDMLDETRAVPGSDATAPFEQSTQSGVNASGTIVVGAIRIEGAQALPPSAFAAVIDSYVGKPLAPTDLKTLASEIAGIARAAGYGLATAWIPAQRSGNGVLRIQLDEGSIAAIEIVGTAQRQVRPMLAPLIGTGPVRTAELERRLLLAGDIAGVSLGRARLERREGRNILHLTTSRDPVSVRAAVDNWGYDAVGPFRARLSLDVNGVLAPDDRLSLGGVTTALQPREFALARAMWTKPIGIEGTELYLGGYYARSHPGGSVTSADLAGQSSEAEIGLRHPLLRSRKASVWASLAFQLRDSSLTRADVDARDDRLATLTAGAYATARLPDGRVRGRLSLVTGFDALGATDAGDPLASRLDADGRFTKLAAWGEYQRRLGSTISIQVQAEGQVSSGPLLASEEMGLGGQYILRAYDYRERSGEHGIAGSAELRFDLNDLPKPVTSTQLYAFAEVGTVDNAGSGGGDGTLGSVGGGVRFSLDRDTDVGVELAFPLTARFNPDNRHGPRLSITAATRF
jgi:hemolysin activation/secretion protein